jgi:hypothetical protein
MWLRAWRGRERTYRFALYALFRAVVALVVLVIPLASETETLVGFSKTGESRNTGVLVRLVPSIEVLAALKADVLLQSRSHIASSLGDKSRVKLRCGQLDSE